MFDDECSAKNEREQILRIFHLPKQSQRRELEQHVQAGLLVRTDVAVIHQGAVKAKRLVGKLQGEQISSTSTTEGRSQITITSASR